MGETMRERAIGVIDAVIMNYGCVDADTSYELAESIADAVLAEMREPTAAMVAAGDACDEMMDQFTATPRHAAECEAHWKAMIDATKDPT